MPQAVISVTEVICSYEIRSLEKQPKGKYHTLMKYLVTYLEVNKQKIKLVTYSGEESKWEGTNTKGKLKSITKSTKTRKYLNSCTRIKIFNFKVKWKVGRSCIFVALTPLFSGSGRLPCGLGGIFSLEREFMV